jgi:hypothetical protein
MVNLQNTKILKFLFGNRAEGREKIVCDTGLLPKPERVPRPHAHSPKGSPNKSFSFIDLIKNRFGSPRDRPIRLPARQPFSRLLGNRKGGHYADCRLFRNATNNADVETYLLSIACRRTRPSQGRGSCGSGSPVALLRDRCSNGFSAPGAPKK